MPRNTPTRRCSNACALGDVGRHGHGGRRICDVRPKRSSAGSLALSFTNGFRQIHRRLPDRKVAMRATRRISRVHAATPRVLAASTRSRVVQMQAKRASSSKPARRRRSAVVLRDAVATATIAGGAHAIGDRNPSGTPAARCPARRWWIRSGHRPMHVRVKLGLFGLHLFTLAFEGAGEVLFERHVHAHLDLLGGALLVFSAIISSGVLHRQQREGEILLAAKVAGVADLPRVACAGSPISARLRNWLVLELPFEGAISPPAAV